jgi:hypothetical protein
VCVCVRAAPRPSAIFRLPHCTNFFGRSPIEFRRCRHHKGLHCGPATRHQTPQRRNASHPTASTPTGANPIIEPADLDLEVSKARDALRQVRRTITELTHEYHRLTAAELEVDKLGDPLAPDTVLTSVRDSLADLKNTLAMAEDSFEVVQRYSSRLKPA